MNRAIELRNDLDDLTLYAERVGTLLNHFDLHTLHDMAARLLLGVAGNAGGLH